MNDPLRMATPPEAERIDALRAEVARRNREEMLRLVERHGLYIRKEDFDDWRPTERVAGEIPGVKDGLTIVATNGILGYFEQQDDWEVFSGHIQHFSGEVRTLFAMPKDGPIKPAATKKTSRPSAAMKLLQETRARFAH